MVFVCLKIIKQSVAMSALYPFCNILTYAWPVSTVLMEPFPVSYVQPKLKGFRTKIKV